ncbi:MAG: GNAT family N-acetyltransferase [Oscillospiraceae bacterium]|nr:GNAT family N-acetyltransferase [Oscillospiraceae bacterium]
MIIKKTTDIDLLVRLRMDYLFDKKERPADTAALQANLRNYFSRHITAGDFLAVIAEENGEVFSAALMTFSERPPRSAEPLVIGTVYSVYTYPHHRRKGYARAVMTSLLDEAKSMGVIVIELLATPDGEALYRSMGFRETDYRYLRMKAE